MPTFLEIVVLLVVIYLAYVNYQNSQRIDDLTEQIKEERKNHKQERKDLYDRLMSRDLQDYTNQFQSPRKKQGSSNFIKNEMDKQKRLKDDDSLE